MSADKPSLDSLRIDRSETSRSLPGWLLWLPVVAILAAGAIWWATRPTAAKVSTAVATEATRSRSGAVLNASGYVTARRHATVSSKVTGRVREVLIEEGMEVEEGQVLARLDDANVRASLALSRAQSDAAMSSLEETRVRLAEAGLQLDRAQRLQDGGVNSEADLDRAHAEVDSLAARLVLQKEEHKVAERRVALELQILEDTIIRAPFAGKVVEKNAQPGEMISPVSAGGGFTRTGIGTIVDMSSLEIEVDVNESYINRVEPGQEVQATLDAYPDWPIPAHVIAIIPTADREKATVRVRVGFDELDSRILPDMGVKVVFLDPESAQQTNGTVPLLIPRSAVRKEGARDFTFVVDGERVERRALTLGLADGLQVTVESGLSAGERVVVRGPSDLADGDLVEETGG